MHGYKWPINCTRTRRMDRAMAQHDHCPDDVAHGFVKQEIWQARLSLSQQNHDRESEKTIEMVL